MAFMLKNEWFGRSLIHQKTNGKPVILKGTKPLGFISPIMFAKKKNTINAHHHQ